MSSKAPIVYQVAWVSLLIQVALIGLFSLLFFLVTTDTNLSAILGCMVTLALVMVLRQTLARYHRQGIRLTKAGRFADAIPQFEKSLSFFTKYQKIDQFRSITLLSSSRMCYREMALCNMAFCHSQIGNGVLARKYYEEVLTQYPTNTVAKAALNLMNAEKQRL